ncbi:MAG: hypothetical protein RLZZ67_134 [Candidatus Parcubacteria bacterium]|jgi:S1-C subfamily serine protease
MNIALYIVLALVLVIPSSAQAAWWKPVSWKVFQKSTTTQAFATTTQALATTTIATTSVQTFAPPSTDELLKRIAELEDKLDKALGKKTGTSVQEKVVKVAIKEDTSSSTGLSEKQLIAKVRPAIISVDTATSSGSGVIIDAQGHALVAAHTLWSVEKGVVVGAADTMSVTFSDGSKKTAKLIGINEAKDIAIIQILGKTSFSYLKLAHDAGVRTGDTVHVFGSPAMRGGSGGIDIAQGTVSQKSSNSVEVLSSVKPLDNSAALVNSKGEFIALPRNPVCKVLEEGEICLKYKIANDVVASTFAKVRDGMKLYKNKKYYTKEEYLVHGQLEGVYNNARESGSIQYAISGLSGKNSFDYFNGKLTDDQEGKITKLYLNKLKVGADSLSKAADSLKAKSHGLNIFFIDEVASVATLGDYQKNILKQIEIENRAKYKEYEKKVSYWSIKKNEYDSLLTRLEDATHDYLTEQGVLMEAEVKYFVAEQQRVLNMVSAETISLF